MYTPNNKCNPVSKESRDLTEFLYILYGHIILHMYTWHIHIHYFSASNKIIHTIQMCLNRKARIRIYSSWILYQDF